MKKLKTILFAAIIFTLSITWLMNNQEEYEVTSIQVEQGDTLWSIAKRHHDNLGISIQDYIYQIRSINNLKDSVIIHPGQTLQIMVKNNSY